ncbi:MAG: GAF domain-containing protein [Leptonema sp. (in: bacteria)]
MEILQPKDFIKEIPDPLGFLVQKNIGFIFLDSDGNIIDVSEKFLQDSKYKKNDLLGKSFFSIIDMDVSDKIDLKEISSKQKTSFFLAKISGKEGNLYWTRNIIVATGDKYIVFQILIDNSLDILKNEKFNHILFKIQKLALESASLKTFLDNTLEILLSIPWLSLQSKAGFMLNYENELKLVSYLNLGSSLVQMCSKVPFGRCLCGKAAERKEIIYKSCVDEDHENRPEGMKPHGHYNIPIVYNDQVLGVLFLYLEDGYPLKEEHLAFLQILSSMLSLIILKYQFENEYQYSLTKLVRMNEELIKNIKRVQQLQELFKTYVPNFLRDAILNNKENQFYFYKEEKYYLLVNINGLLKFSNIFPIQKVYETLNEFYSPIIDIVLERNGEIEQYLEDKVFAIFYNAENTLQSAIEIKKKLEFLNKKREELLLKPFYFQIALNYGSSFVGVVGSTKRKNWLRYSETIRWLEAMQRKCDFNEILVSDEYYNELKTKYKFSKKYKLIRDRDPSNFIYVRYWEES